MMVRSGKGPPSEWAFTERRIGLLDIPSRGGNLPCILLRFHPQCQRPLRHGSFPAPPLSAPEPSPNAVGVDDSRVKAGRSAAPRTTIHAPRWRSPRQAIRSSCTALRAVVPRPSLLLLASPRVICSQMICPPCPYQNAPTISARAFPNRQGDRRRRISPYRSRSNYSLMM